MERIALNAKKRQKTTKSYLNELRNMGNIPAVIYGKNFENQNIYVNSKEVYKIIKEHGPNVLVDLKLDNETIPSLIKEVQKHMIKGEIIHIDFQKVNLHEKITTTVPLRFKNTEIVESSEAIIQYQLNELEIKCLPNDLPEYLEVDVKGLTIGDSLTVSEVDVPEGVEVLNEPEEIVLTVTHTTEFVEPEETVEEAVEPEVITEKEEEEAAE